MQYITALLGIIFFVLAFFFYGEYLDSNTLNSFFDGHKYYFSMLSTATNWYIVLFGFLFALLPVFYLILKKRNISGYGLFTYIFLGFSAFMLTLGINKGGFVSIGFIIEIINYIIIFSYYSVILLGVLSLGNIVLKKISFKQAIYDFAIKFGVGFGLLTVVLYYLTTFSLLNIYISYIVLLALLGLAFYQRQFLKEIGTGLLDSLKSLFQEIDSLGYIKYAYYFVFGLVFFYIFVGFNYTFIPYPTAWDANHAYMFYPRVFAEYGGYPWFTDFRPALSLWSAILSWVYNLGFWTWFSQDTWMITFNFVSAILALFFSFMLLNILLKLLKLSKKREDIVKVLGYILVMSWFTSGMGAFLVFIDNKTDLAVLMYVVLALFMLVYTFYRFQNDKENRKLDLVFLALSGIFFAFANIIKPTATFDFFESVIVYSFLNIGVLIVIGAVLFVGGFLAYLKFRGFDKAISPKNSMLLLIVGTLISSVDLVLGWIKDKIKILGVFVLVGSFVLTLILTKGVFGLAQIMYGENINTNVGKIAEGFIAGSSLPTIKKDNLTGTLYTGLKKEIGSAYNEDNTRYVGYGSLSFGDVWWSFIVPEKYKKSYCINFISNQKLNCENVLNINDKSYISNAVLKDYTQKIFDTLDQKEINDGVDYMIKQAELKGDLNNLAKQLSLDTNLPEFKLKKVIKEKLLDNTVKNLKGKIVQNLRNGKLDIKDFELVGNKDKLQKILNNIKNGVKFKNVEIPYRKLIPFNVVFNWSLQNLSSYYTDIGIIWIFLVFVVIIALVYSLGKIGYYLYVLFNLRNKLKYENSKIEKNEEYIQELEEKIIFIKKQLYDYKLLFAFSIATLLGWNIWLFVAEGIVWYNIGGIIWLIVTSIIFVAKWKDKYVLAFVLMFIAVVGIVLNLFRIASQGGGQIQTWYKSSIGKKVIYIQENGGFKPEQDIKIPYTFDDVFNLQFSMYNKAIEGFNTRKQSERGIIGGTYIKYFIKNQNKITDDQFLMYLWKLGSDDNIDKFYARLKDQGIKDIVLDPNIASVVMGTGNIDLWYRYFGKVDKNGNLVEKGVFPYFVDLAQAGKLQYGYTNNLGIKYALIYSDKDLMNILGLKSEKEARNIKYLLIALKFIQRNIAFDYPDSDISKKMFETAIVALQKILITRLEDMKKGNMDKIMSDLADINALNVNDYKKVIEKWQTDFSSLNDDEQKLFLNFLSVYNQLRTNNAQSVVRNILQQSLGGRAQLMYVKIK